MAITYPLDLISDFPGWTTQFELRWRQEQSRMANGRTFVKDFGSPLWAASYQTRVLKPNELDYWRARLDAMEGGLKIFLGRPLSRCNPIGRPGAGTIANGTVATITADRKNITLAGIAGTSLQPGDMIRIGTRDLHRVVDGTGLSVEVRPHIWPGVATGAVASVQRPYCHMVIEPGTVSSQADPQTGRGVISFQAIEAR